MGDIKIKVTEITVPNDFKIYYKAGNTPYPFDIGYTDYGQIFSGGTTTIDLIGDFAFGTEYWIMAKEFLYPERWMVKNILINAEVVYAQFMVGSPTPTPTPSATKGVTPSRTPSVSITPSVTPTIVSSRTPTPTRTHSITPTRTLTPSRTPSATQTVFSYGVNFFACVGVNCGSNIGSAHIDTTIPLVVGKYYHTSDGGSKAVEVVTTQSPGGSALTIDGGPFNTCNGACA